MSVSRFASLVQGSICVSFVRLSLSFAKTGMSSTPQEEAVGAAGRQEVVGAHHPQVVEEVVVVRHH